MHDLWTQSLSLRWRPELRFYEKRIEILKSFEEHGYLRAFRVQENFIDARFFGSRDSVSVQQNGLDVFLGHPGSDVDRALAAVEISLSAVIPTQPRRFLASFQHLTPLTMQFEDAVSRAYGGVLGRLGTEGIEVDDWALLADISSKEGLPGQIEFGIVRAEEVPLRLSRSAGRVQHEAAAPEDWPEPAEFADVSLFSDLAIRRTDVGSIETLRDEVQSFWQTARSEADRLVSTLEKALVGDDRQGEVAR
ncbi:MAG: hypothetical protein WKF33_10555 [Thermoleophilaceae bacterium]